jgi:Transposase DDE domain
VIIDKNLTATATLLEHATIVERYTHHTGEYVMISHHKESRQTRRLRERTKVKTEQAELNADKEAYFQISYLLRKSINEIQLKELAKKTGVIVRNRELTALAFVGILMMGCVCDTEDEGIRSLKRMCLLLRKYYDGTIKIRPQALQQKINLPETAKFIKEIMMRVLAYKIDKSLKKILGKRKITSLFRILLQDSTVISLPESLKRIFRGCGGAASEAALKCDFIIDQSNHVVLHVKFIAGKVPDVKMSADIIDYLEEGDLVIRDLGYFNLSQLSRISSRKGSKFISRLSKKTNVYLNKDDNESVDLIKHLKALEVEKGDVDTDIYIGKLERLHVRLIGVKVPPEVVEARRQQYKTNRKKQEPSEELREWNGYTLMITNFSRETLSLKMILKLYKIRWQIELFFKNMKSNLCVDKMTGKNKYRILSIIYIKIVLTWVVAHLYSYAQRIVGIHEEVSLDQLTKWLMEDGRLRIAFVMGDLSSLLDELKRDVDLLCKQKRKRPTTLQEIEEAYEEEYDGKNAA